MKQGYTTQNLKISFSRFFKPLLVQVNQAFLMGASLLLAVVLMTTSFAFAPLVQAQQISQAQIEQFKKLPKAQQEALARQYGVDLSMLEQQSKSGQSGTAEDVKLVTERGSDAEETLEKATEGTQSKLPVFGMNLFKGKPSTYAPLNNAPVPGNYRLGAGDSIQVQYFGKETGSYLLEINREGYVSLPQIGPISVAGLRYDEMKDLLQSEIDNRLIGVRSAISMGQLRSIQIFVLGESYQPGAYTVSALTTLSQALFVSGGLTDLASLRNIRLMRAGEVVTEFDLYDLLVYGDASKDRLLQPGDTLFIPSRGSLVKLTGEVSRPAYYEVKAGESIEKLVEFAGGFLPTAYKKSLLLRRVEQGQLESKTLNVTSSEGLAHVITSGDTVHVPMISAAIDNAVRLRGALVRPGEYQWKVGTRVGDFIKSTTQDLLPDVDLSYGLVIREDVNQRKIEVFQFDVSQMLEGVESQNLRLEPRDRVFFFSRFQREEERANAGYGTYAEYPNKAGDKPAINSRTSLLRPILARLNSQRTQDTSALFVQVSGEVRFPGTYPLVKNAQVADLIAAAGGLKESAYLARAEITRTEIKGEIAETDYVSFNLLDALTGSKGVEVKARDRLNIFQVPEWQDTVRVRIAGEVRFPGTYEMRRGETLSDLLARAGGLTQHAHLGSAVFTRDDIRTREREQVKSLAKSLRQEMASMSLTEGGSVGYEQMNQLLTDLVDVEPVGRLVLDLNKAMEGDKEYDVELDGGDALYIPSQNHTISIVGEVNMPTTYRYQEGLSVQEYIARSGGTKRRADEKRMFVVRASGEVVPYSPRRGWFTSSERVQLEPGDTIVVPLNATYKDNMQLWATSTQIIYQLAVAAAAISRI